MHFRHVDDEILFGRLKAQLIESLRGAPTHMLANVLRVLGRIESVAFYEGVRQGVVARAIENAVLPHMEEVRPIAMHARVYAGAFTPLTTAEERYILESIGDASSVIEEIQLHGDLAATPLEMPPMTLAEALAAPTGSLAAPTPRDAAAARAYDAALHGPFATSEPDPALLTTIFAKEAADAAAHEAEFPLMDEPVSPWLTTLSDEAGDEQLRKLLGDPSDDFADVIKAAESDSVFGAQMLRTDGSKMADEKPDFIERCRDALQGRMGAGWGPANWTEVVFAVRDELKVDPFVIDLTLSTDVGKSMLRSIGLFEIADALLGEADINAMLHSRPCASST